MMSRGKSMIPAPGFLVYDPLARERIKTAQEISLQALAMAKRARHCGLNSLGHVLELAALEAATISCTGGNE
jgi:hypothetical protein